MVHIWSIYGYGSYIILMVNMVSIWALLALGPPEFQAMASLSTNSLGCLTRQCFGLAQKTRAQYAGFHGGTPKAGWFIYI